MKMCRKSLLFFLALFFYTQNSFGAGEVFNIYDPKQPNEQKQQFIKAAKPNYVKSEANKKSFSKANKKFVNRKKTGFFIGTDLMTTKTHLDYDRSGYMLDMPDALAPSSWSYDILPGGKAGSNVGKGFGTDGLDYGINFGYEASLKNFLFRPEIAYEKFNHSSINDPDCGFTQPDIYTSDPCSSKASISYRFGPKLSLGYKIFGNTSIYATAGYTLTNYSTYLQNTPEVKEISRYASGNAKAPIFGGQIIYDLNNSFGIKLAYDYQNLKINLPSENLAMAMANFQNIVTEKTTYRINLQTIKLGIIYNF